jgi:hypothetical protein
MPMLRIEEVLDVVGDLPGTAPAMIANIFFGEFA